MYEYKKVRFELTPSNLSTKKIDDSLNKMYEIIEDNAKDGWRFIQIVHPYPVNNLCMILFEKEKDDIAHKNHEG